MLSAKIWKYRDNFSFPNGYYTLWCHITSDGWGTYVLRYFNTIVAIWLLQLFVNHIINFNPTVHQKKKKEKTNKGADFNKNWRKCNFSFSFTELTEHWTETICIPNTYQKILSLQTGMCMCIFVPTGLYSGYRKVVPMEPYIFFYILTNCFLECKNYLLTGNVVKT